MTSSAPATPLTPTAAGAAGPAASALVRALRGERDVRPPVWFMRQAGRSLPEYRELRVGTRMLDVCLDPALASEITLQPVRRHGVDAAIFFSDIVVPLRLAGVDVVIEPGRGPVFANPVRSVADVDRLTAIDPEVVAEAAAPIREAVRLTTAALGDTPLIGFAGAPFTLAAYLVEGGPSKEHLRARAMMHADPDSWHRLAGWLAQVSHAFLTAQTDAGASAVQLFDSWAGSLSVADYRAFIAPHSRVALDGFTVPRIHFGVGTAHLLADMRLDGMADTVGVDWRTPLDEAAAILGADTTVQGNIDPALLAAPWPVLEAHVRGIVQRGRAARAHVLNLGHGVPPETDPTVLTRIVELVHGLDLDAAVGGAE
ncbi:MAG: uroporphyrinogen decarboxylase [Actinobacteria bacterium]|nr:uroporphyrinogen decarboxylase [Actinomycetota bacterium]